MQAIHFFQQGEKMKEDIAIFCAARQTFFFILLQASVPLKKKCFFSPPNLNKHPYSF